VGQGPLEVLHGLDGIELGHADKGVVAEGRQHPVAGATTLLDAGRAQIREALEQSTAPVLLCSFGKDSMVLLHLLRSMGLDLPIVFHRDPWFPHKYAFADRMIREWNLTVWDWQPVAVSLWHGKGIVAFTNHYQIGQKPTGEPVTCCVPKNILPPVEGKPYLCGLADLMHRPTGTFQYPWDMAFIGHKSSDQDQIAGRVPLHTDLVRVDQAHHHEAVARPGEGDVEATAVCEEAHRPVGVGAHERHDKGLLLATLEPVHRSHLHAPHAPPL
jgi:hypothetical protein